MPIFNFTFSPPSAGCVQSVVMSSPWTQSQQNPQTGAMMNPAESAWYWLMNFANQRDQAGNPILFFPPGCQIGCQCLAPTGGEKEPAKIISVQKSEPSVDRQQVNAPFGQPIGNGHALNLPPEQPRQGAPRAVPSGAYEDLTDCALSNTSDSIMGEMDGAGGTFTDISIDGRTEVVRQHFMPPSPKVTDRR